LLGPPLFFIFINDLDLAALLVTLLKKSGDDTKLGQIIRNHQDTLNLQAKLDSLMDWAAKWGMAFNGFNTMKCKVMHMGRHSQRQHYNHKWAQNRYFVNSYL
jgi:hypothetical protein